MRGIIRALFVVLALAGLGIVAVNVISIYGVYGESGKASVFKAFVVAVTDQLLMSQMIAAGALFVIGVLGLVVMAVAGRPRAKAAAEEETKPESVPEE